MTSILIGIGVISGVLVIAAIIYMIILAQEFKH